MQPVISVEANTEAGRRCLKSIADAYIALGRALQAYLQATAATASAQTTTVTVVNGKPSAPSAVTLTR